MNKNKRVVAFFILVILIILNVVIYYYFKTNINSIPTIFYSYNLYSVLTFALLFITIIKIGEQFSVHAIATFFAFLFLYGRSLLYIFEPNNDFFETELLDYEYIGYVNMFYAMVVTNIFLYTINTVYILFGKPDELNLDQNIKSNKIELFLYNFILVIGFLYGVKLFLEFKAIKSIGYAAIYAGGLQDINYFSPIIKYSHILFISFFSYYLIVVNNKKRFIIIASIYLVLSFMDSLKGARITLILPIFFVLWYYNSLYKIKINYKTLIRSTFLLLLLSIFSIYSSSKRNDIEVELKTNIVKSIIFESGSTLQVVGRFIKNEDKLTASYPYFLEPIFYPYFYFKYFDILTKGQSVEMLEHRNSLNHQLSAFVNKQAYLVGAGLGSSSPAEFYQYGIIPLIFFSFAYGLILIYFYSQLNNKLLIFLSTTIVLHFFFISRDTPFPNLIGILKSVLVYYGLKTIFSIKLR